MAFTIDNSVPANGENIGAGLGSSRIRAVTTWLLQMFGFSGAAAQTINVAPFVPDSTFSASGLLTLPADPVSALGIATKQYVDNETTVEAIITNGRAGAAFTGTPVPAITAYKLLELYSVKWSNNNVGSDTLNLNALGAINILKNTSGTLVPLVAGDVVAGMTTVLAYDGTSFQVVNGLGIPQHGIQVLLTPGAGNFTVPPGVTTLIADIYGGSGGGGGGAALTGGGGGGGGAHTRITSNAFTPGGSVAYVVGAAGVGGAGNADGTAGGISTFNSVSANSGQGGAHNGPGGLAATAQTGFGWIENEAGLAGAAGSGAGNAAGGANFQPGGAGGAIGAANPGSNGYPGVIIIQW